MNIGRFILTKCFILVSDDISHPTLCQQLWAGGQTGTDIYRKERRQRKPSEYTYEVLRRLADLLVCKPRVVEDSVHGKSFVKLASSNATALLVFKFSYCGCVVCMRFILRTVFIRGDVGIWAS